MILHICEPTSDFILSHRWIKMVNKQKTQNINHKKNPNFINFTLNPYFGTKSGTITGFSSKAQFDSN